MSGSVAYDAPGVAWDQSLLDWDGEQALDARPRHTSAKIRQQVIARVLPAQVTARVREAQR